MTDKFDTEGKIADDDARLERLVDGELSPDEYRELVARLDEQPDGWRRCALAFLESQALGGELAGIRRATDSRANGPMESTAAAPRRVVSNVWSLLAIAASFLVVFGLGLAAPRLVAKWRQEKSFAGNLPSGQTEIATAGAEDAPHRTLRPIGNVTLVMDSPSGGTTRAGQVPVYEVQDDLNRYLSSERPALAPELVDWLRQRGFDVQHQPQYYPAPLDDGRQIIVPIDGYQITPMGRRY